MTTEKLPYFVSRGDTVDFDFVGIRHRGSVLQLYGGTVPAFALVKVQGYPHPFTISYGDLRRADSETGGSQ